MGAALGILLTASAAMFGTLFVASYVVQGELGMDPLRAGLAALPGGVAMVLGAPVAAVLLRLYGARRTTVAALAVLALGVLVLFRAVGTGAVGGGFLLLGAGFGTVMVSATAVVVRHAAAESAGVAGGLQQTAMNVGPVLGVAMATTLAAVTDGLRSALPVLAGTAALGYWRPWNCRTWVNRGRRLPDPCVTMGGLRPEVVLSGNDRTASQATGGERWHSCDKRSIRARSGWTRRRSTASTSTSPTLSTRDGCPASSCPWPAPAASHTSPRTAGAT